MGWKNEYAATCLDPMYTNRVRLPEGMVSGYYKYIVFDAVEPSTGKVYDTPCHSLMKRNDDLPNTDWVAHNHWCVPIYYHGADYLPDGSPHGRVDGHLRPGSGQTHAGGRQGQYHQHRLPCQHPQM